MRIETTVRVRSGKIAHAAGVKCYAVLCSSPACGADADPAPAGHAMTARKPPVL